jgi:hypothetical protein
MMALTGITEDPQERMKAFVEKRPPVFKHQKKNDAAPETGQEH